MELEQALKAAWDGTAILFLGAGFSRGARNLAGNDYSLGSDLAKDLSTEIGAAFTPTLDDAAEMYVDQFGEDALIEKLKQAFYAKSVAAFHIEIASVPWRRVYTTNYDNVFERASSETRRQADSISPLDNISSISKTGLLCVHLNGSIQRTTKETIWEDIKLTQLSYDKGSALDTEWGNLFRADLQAANAIFFVGYSLYDLDVRRVLFPEQLQEKTFFVLKDMDLATAHRVNKYGTAIAAGTEDFASQLIRFHATYVPDTDPRPLFHSIIPYTLEIGPPKLEDRYVFELLLAGRMRRDFMQASYLGQVNYVGSRAASHLAMSMIEEGRHAVILHAGLGNGKTVALEEVKFLAHQKDYRVFTVANRGHLLMSELHYAFVEKGKKLFVVDNYAEWMDVLPVFRTFNSEDFALVLSARSSANDLLIDRLVETLGTADVAEIPCDDLSNIELEWLRDFFTEFGIWGEMASWSPERKAVHLLQTCGGKWSGVLLRLLEAPHIVARLATLFKSLKEAGTYREPLVQLLVLAVLDSKPETPVLLDLCGTRILEAGFRRDPVASELVQFGTYSAGVRSSITAEALLHGVVDPNLITQSYINLVQRADRIAKESTFNWELLKTLMRLRNIQQVLPEKDRVRGAMRVYEEIKNLENCKRSPLFWLQYAIAATVARDFTRAKSYFDTAYSFAKGLEKYDAFQIDNYYARFLVEQATDRGNATEAMEAFRNSKLLLFPQLTNDRRIHPYRSATPWGALYTRFRSEWDGGFKNEVCKAATYVKECIEQLPPDQSSKRVVEDCLKAMHGIILDVEGTSSLSS